jgi:hypothetical protein
VAGKSGFGDALFGCPWDRGVGGHPQVFDVSEGMKGRAATQPARAAMSVSRLLLLINFAMIKIHQWVFLGISGISEVV